MNKDDVAILHSVQKNTEMAMKAIDTIEDKVQDKELALLLTKTTQKYSEVCIYCRRSYGVYRNCGCCNYYSYKWP